MSDKHFTVNYGKGVTVFPEKAIGKIVGGEATLTEIKTLSLILASNGAITVSEISAAASLSPQDVENAVAFWRGTGIVSVKEGKVRPVSEPKNGTAEISVPVSSAVTVTESDAGVEPSAVETAHKKALLSAEMPKYSGQEISELLSKDGGKLKTMLDECQQLIGHIFNPRETETLIGICDWLGVETDFVITVTAYYTKKKPGCKVGYIQKAALDLVNNGIDTIDLLDEYLRQMEIYDGLAGKLRTWIGIGERTYTKKENSIINHWIRDLGYGEELVKYAYELTVEHKTVFKFDYANGILENWYKSGVRTLADAQAREQTFRDGRAAEKGGNESSSFNTDQFYDLAIKRSYKGMAEADGKKDN